MSKLLSPEALAALPKQAEADKPEFIEGAFYKISVPDRVTARVWQVLSGMAQAEMRGGYKRLVMWHFGRPSAGSHSWADAIRITPRQPHTQAETRANKETKQRRSAAFLRRISRPGARRKH